MIDVSPFIAKLLTVVVAGCLYVVAAYIPDVAIKIALCSLASGLSGWQLLPRVGDVALKAMHPDDL